MTSEVPVLDIESWSDPFPQSVKAELAKHLPAYIEGQRWYRAKAKSMRKLSITDVVSVSEKEFVLVVEIRYSDETSSTYLLPVSLDVPSIRSGDREIIAGLRAKPDENRFLMSALASVELRNALLNAIVCDKRFPGERGELVASHTAALGEVCDSIPEVESAVSRAEQSNSSIIYGDLFILKLFRKIEPGINPDIEVGAFLTAHGFRHTPAVLGGLEYLIPEEEPYTVGILQQFVKNRGDAWKYTLESLSHFFGRALALGEKPELFALGKQHPLSLARRPLPDEARQALGTYLDSAELLGKRTAQMHATLAAPEAPPAFAPEPVRTPEREAMYKAMLSEADMAFETLRRKESALKDPAASDARQLLQLEHEVIARFHAFRDAPLTALSIRFHGDYHLGQVLFTGEDFMIIDFEGEPARPLAERRAKGLALRDVAGMVRSFGYAAFAALLGGIEGVSGDREALPLVENWAAFWSSCVTGMYLRAYLSEAGAGSFVPASIEEQRMMLDAFILQKALYEVSYELNNRPDWVRIPLRGILSLANYSPLA